TIFRPLARRCRRRGAMRLTPVGSVAARCPQRGAPADHRSSNSPSTKTSVARRWPANGGVLYRPDGNLAAFFDGGMALEWPVGGEHYGGRGGGACTGRCRG